MFPTIHEVACELAHIANGETSDSSAALIFHGATIIEFEQILERAMLLGKIRPRSRITGAFDDASAFMGKNASVCREDAVALLISEGVNSLSDSMSAKTSAPLAKAWATKAIDLAKIYIDAWRNAGYSPTKQDAALYVEGVFSTDGIYGDRKQVLDSAYIERHALKGITGKKPGAKSKNPKVPDGLRGKLPTTK